MKIITEYPIITVNIGEGETSSSARGGRGGGGRMGGGRPMGGRPMGGRPMGGRPMGGGRRRRFYGRRPIVVGGGLYWNGAYWVDGSGLCYEKDWQGVYTLVDCDRVPNVALGL